MTESLAGKRIFVIEDNAYNVALLQTILQQNGAIVAFERWGKDTLRLLRNFAPVDLILLDLMFPRGVTGYDVFDEIRTAPEFQQVPIVAVTAADPDEEMPKVRAKGFSGFIRKPIRYGVFERQLADVLAGKSIWAVE
ncbi:MAG: response regulator [Chloroflexi bacterium]|nr:MAG: response regulator [Chloroflexota bacterium]